MARAQPRPRLRPRKFRSTLQDISRRADRYSLFFSRDIMQRSKRRKQTYAQYLREFIEFVIERGYDEASSTVY